MSWYSGTQLTLVACAGWAIWRRIISALARMLPCDTTTPLGVEVEPEVYCKRAMSVPPGWREGAVAGRSCVASTDSQATPDAKRSAKSGRDRSRSVLARITRGAQSARIAALESRAAMRRGTIIGTATIPAAKQARTATTPSRPGGNSSTARSPHAACCIRSAATACTSCRSRAYVRVAGLPPRSGR